MPWELAAPDARFTFVVGKGGVGKTTTAALLALAWAGPGRRVHALSTDPAHSLGDVFDRPLPAGAPCSVCVPTLTVEELVAEARAAAWRDRIRVPLTDLLERGSYLDREDVDRFTALRIPGVDELMAALRLVELLDTPADHVVVDTAPTGHTLRLLDAATLLESWTDALAALAAKADAVTDALFRGAAGSAGGSLRAEVETALARYRSDVLAAAAFVIVTRDEPAVRLETDRLAAGLAVRGLRVRARLQVGLGSAAPGTVRLPWWPESPRGCRALEVAVQQLEGQDAAPGGLAAPAPGPAAAPVVGPAGRGSGLAWLEARPQRLLMFAGKGGVGKSTCAAAAAVALARTRPVLLLSVDPAGSLGDLLGCDVGPAARPVTPGLRVQQIDAGGAVARWRAGARGTVEPFLKRLRLGGDPALDRRVFESLWDLAPPGMDEIVALSELLDAAAAAETVVLDTAPTGHFLRLLALPAMALEWTRALMRMLLKYGVTAELDAVAKDVVAFARQLRELQARLADDRWTGAVLVTLAEPVVTAETDRLRSALAQAGVPVAAVLVNRRPARDATPAPAPVLAAPHLSPAPRGPDALLAFAAQWELQ